MERMTPDDVNMLRIEDDVSAVHGLTIGVFAGPQPSFDDVQDLVESRIGFVPRCRQRLVKVPFDLERPVWVDDPHFSIDFHVRATALPERREIDALSALVSRLQSQRMDRGKPLWELWVVSNLKEDHWGLISKVHYAMIDGVSGTDLFGILLDETPTHSERHEFSPKKLPGRRELIQDAVSDLLFDPVETIQAASTAAAIPIGAVRRAVNGLFPRPETVGFRAQIGPHRRWHRCQLPLDLFHKVRDSHGCDTSDVVLAAIAGGIRHYLLDQGEPVPKSLTALIPLAIASEQTGFTHDVTATRARLPLGIEDPLARLDAISAQTALTARTRGAVAGDALRRQDQFSAPTVMALGMRSAMREAHEAAGIDTVLLNVPGPEDTQHVLGRELLKAYPVIPLAGRVRMAIAALSYRDTLSLGITGDYDATPDMHVLAEGIAAAVDELVV